MILYCSILKPLFRPTWLEDTQVKAEHQQMAKKFLKESTTISLIKVTLPPDLPEFENVGRQCECCYKEGSKLKTYVKCTECGILLCLIKERNFFKEHHS